MEPDKYADLIVSSKDYFALPEDEIRTLTSALNLVGGSIVYAGPRVRRPGSTLEVINGGSPVPVGEPPVYQRPIFLGRAGLFDVDDYHDVA